MSMSDYIYFMMSQSAHISVSYWFMVCMHNKWGTLECRGKHPSEHLVIHFHSAVWEYNQKFIHNIFYSWFWDTRFHVHLIGYVAMQSPGLPQLVILISLYLSVPSSSWMPRLWPSPPSLSLPDSSLTRSCTCRQTARHRHPRWSEWLRGPAASDPWRATWPRAGLPWGRWPCICPLLRREWSCTCGLDKLYTACHQFPVKSGRKADKQPVNGGNFMSLNIIW